MKKNIVNAIAYFCAIATFTGAVATVNVTTSLKDGSSVKDDFLTKGLFTYDPVSSPAHNTKSPFLIDDFKIWHYAKTDMLK